MEMLPLLVLTLWCATLSCIDLRQRRLPNALTMPGAIAVLGYGYAVGRPVAAGLGALLLATPYLFVHVLSPAALGAGDVKLAVGLGAATALGGAQSWVWAALAAPMITASAGVGLLLAQAARPRDSPNSDLSVGPVAHGPAMCAASLLALLAAR